MALFTDTFSGADGTTINGRAGWTKYGSGATDTPMLNGSSQLKTGGADPGDSAIYGQSYASADHFVQVTWSANAITSLATNTCIAVRATDRNQMVYTKYDDSDGRWGIYLIGSTTVGDGRYASAVASAPTTSTVVRLKVSGSDYSLYVDNMTTALVTATFTDSSYTSITQCGLMARSTTARNPILAGPYYSGLLSDIGSIGGGGGSVSIPVFMNNYRRGRTS